MLDYKTLLASESDFRDHMTGEVEPFLEAHTTRGTFESFDGNTIAYRILKADKPKASVMLIHGFSEFMEKYNELIYILLCNSINVYAIDLRGHGDSVRFCEDPSKVDVGSFSDYVEDLKVFYDRFLKDSSIPLYLFGHSMGGAIAILYAEKYPRDFKKCVFSSPMVRMNASKYPFALILGASFLYSKILRHPLDYAAGQHPFDPASRLEQSSCCSSARYEYIMDMRRSEVKNQTWSGTYGWVFAACLSSIRLLNPRRIKRITRPVLVLGAGHDRLVDEAYMRKFLARLPHAEYRFFPDSRHEIYHGNYEDRKRFYEEVLQFLA